MILLFVLISHPTYVDILKLLKLFKFFQNYRGDFICFAFGKSFLSIVNYTYMW